MFKPSILNYNRESDRKLLDSLFKNPEVKIIDTFDSQVLELIKIRNPQFPFKRNEEIILSKKADYFKDKKHNELGNWVYYPWRSELIHLLEESEFIEVRTNRNRFKITDVEHEILAQRIIGIAGLSVGRSLAKTIALERICGEIRLADFDLLELSNLNRISVGVDELGINKAVSAAREIALLDPYLKITVFEEGLTEENMKSFFTDGGKLDLFVEECDSLDIKITSRNYSKKLHIPVYMEASDRCMIDIERFDLEPSLPILHGLLEGLDLGELKLLKTDEEKLPYLLKMVGIDTLSPRMRSSMLEIEQQVVSWPQLASSVQLGAGISCSIIRDILLKRVEGSGRFYIDEDQLIPLHRVRGNRSFSEFEYGKKPLLSIDDIKSELAKHQLGIDISDICNEDLTEIVEAAHSAPSGGNTQPWKWVWMDKRLYLFHDESYSDSLLDYSKLASRVALGCSTENLILKACEMGYETDVVLNPDKESGLIAGFVLTKNSDVAHDVLSDYIYSRSTDRDVSNMEAIPERHLNALKEELGPNNRFGLRLITEKDITKDIGEELAEVERLRMLNPRGHRDFIEEIKWNEDKAGYDREGIDLNSVSLDQSELVGISMIKDPLVMDEIESERGGGTFKKLTRKAVESAGALGVITSDRNDMDTWFMSGRFLQRIWLKCSQLGLGFQPQSPISFLKERNEHSDDGLKGYTFNAKIDACHARMFRHLGLGENSTLHFVFRLTYPISVGPKSLRRPLRQNLIMVS